MTENELDQMLDRWKAPAPSAELRRRVLDSLPRLEPRSYRRPLRWGLAIAAATCLLAVGMGQTGHFGLGGFANGVTQLHNDTVMWFEQMWWDHVTARFFGSHPAISVDGEARSDVKFHGHASGMWVEIPGEGRYYFTIGRGAHTGQALPPAGKFDGRVLEFHAGTRAVRVEAESTYGLGGEKKVYVIGTRAER